MTYRFKPLNNLHLITILYYYIFVAGFFNFFSLINYIDNKIIDVYLLISLGVINFIPILGYLLFRMLYPFKYFIDKNYLIKYKGDKVIFKIKMEDIEGIIIKKAHFFDYLILPFSFSFLCDFSNKHLSSISIRYKKCDFIDETINYEFERIKTIKNECGLNEYIDILPSRTAKKICKFMNKTIVME